jgi:hypothetical protein
MDNPVIDNTQTRAICDEIGERLRTLLKSTAPDERPDFDGLAEPEWFRSDEHR